MEAVKFSTIESITNTLLLNASFIDILVYLFDIINSNKE